MPSTYSTNLALELIGTGEQAGTWGTTTNTNLGTLLEQAISGYVTQAITDGVDTTITIPNGATGVARNMYIECTGALTANRNLIVPANRKLYFIFNNTTGGFAVTVKVSGLTGISVPNGKKMVLTSNGTDIVAAENYIADFGSNSATITNIAATSITVTNTPAFVGNGTLTMNVSGTGLSGSQTFTANQSGAATFTVTSNATSANTASTIVARDASGNFSAGTITAALNGNASTATTASNVNNGTLTMNVSGTGLSGSQTFTANQSGNATFTVTSNATNANTASTIVARDASGNFSAGTITAALSGNATTATTATTATNVSGGGQISAASGTITTISGTTGTFTTLSDGAGNIRNVPSAGADKNTSYTLATSDIGEFVTVVSGGSISVPNDTFAAGNLVSIFNNTTGNISINCPITTAYAAGTDVDKASVTLSTRGIANILFINPSLCVITGNIS